jgi:hypothetical protein
MSVIDRWRRLDAGRGVFWTLVLYVLFMAWQAVRLAFFGWLAGLPWVALIPAGLAVGGGILVAAWQRERPWSWFVLVVLVTLHLLAYGGPLLFGDISPATAIGTAVSVALVVLLLHPDGRARIEPRPAPTDPPSWRALP